MTSDAPQELSPRVVALPDEGAGAPSPRQEAPAPSGQRRVLANFASLTAGSFVEKIITFAGSIYSRRVLGAVAVGQLNWAGAVISYFGLLINPGLEMIAKREVARAPAQATRYASALLMLQLILAAVAFAIVAVLCLANVRGPTVSLLMLLQGIQLLLVPFDFVWLLQATERMIVAATASIVLQLLQLPALFLLVHHPSDAARFALLPYPFRFALIVFVARYASRAGLIDWRKLSFSWRDSISLLKESLPMGLSQASMAIYYSIDSVILGFSHGDRVVGLYSTAYKLMLMPTMLSQALIVSFYPALSRTRGDDREAALLSMRFLKLLTWFGFPIAALTWSMGRHFIVLFYGRGYSDVGPTYEWLSLNLALVFLNIGLVFPFTAWGRQATQFKITLAAAAANLGANLVLIPILGATGAVITTLLSEAIVFVCGSTVRRTLHPIRWFRAILVPLSCSIGVALLLRAVARVEWVPWPVAAIAGGAVLAACAAVLEPEITRFLSRVLRRKG